MPAPRKKQTTRPPNNLVPHECCWAKTQGDGSPGINVRDHCLNVGFVAEALLALLPPGLRQRYPDGSATLAALHDVGKVSPGFQAKCPGWLSQHQLTDRAIAEAWSQLETDHAKVSQLVVQQLLGDLRLHKWAAAVGAHHGRIKGETIQAGTPWQEERLRLAEELVGVFGPLPTNPPDEATVWLVAGLITVADWIGSDERNFPQNPSASISERCRLARVALDEIGWRPARIKASADFHDLFPEIAAANSLQTTTLETVSAPGVYIIEGPMGVGKTEAALAAAYSILSSGNATGLYFALPTQTTSNRIHVRVGRWADRISATTIKVRLSHSSSWLVEAVASLQLRPAGSGAQASEDVQEGRSWFTTAKRALLAPYGVGTIDQALLGIVAAKHFFVRQFALAGKVVILDEVHTYDLYTGTLVAALVKRLRDLGCTVIILSATLIEKRRRELLGVPSELKLSDAYPLVSGQNGDLIQRECVAPPSTTVQIRRYREGIPISEVLTRARRGECVLWIRNTVDHAQEAYAALRLAAGSGLEIGLLHSRFPFFRREEIESDWMDRLGKDSNNRPSGCVLVSTQIAEQSVDIDADLLLTDLAPTDMLLQRLGRLWRHKRSRPCSCPEVWIQMPAFDDSSLFQLGTKDILQAFGKNARVYAPYVLLRSLQQWIGRDTINLPGDIRQILEATYRDLPAGEPAAWQELRRDLDKQKEKLSRLAISATTVWNTPVLQDEFIQTRFNTSPTAQLLLLRGFDEGDADSLRLELLSGGTSFIRQDDWDFNTAKSIHRNLVRMPRWAINEGVTRPPRWLATYVPGPAAAGVVQSDGGISWLGSSSSTGLTYGPDIGITIDRKKLPDTIMESEFDESGD